MRVTQPSLSDPLVDHALFWASRGWLVFPLYYPIDGDVCSCGKTHTNGDSGKHPDRDLVPHGKDDATSNSTTIKGWWAAKPLANIGGRPPAGQFVVDIDGPLDEGIEFPDTWENSTGKGRHLVYRQNPDPAKYIDQTGSTLWANVDTRTHDKGYVVLPPSLHRTGIRYAVTHARDVIEFPAELVPVKGRRAHRRVTAANDEIIKLLTMPRDAAELGDDAMTKVAGYIARIATTKEHFEGLLWAINAGLAEPLDTTALNKKRGIWDKHQQTLEQKKEKAVDDESRGWLLELGSAGYDSPIEGRDGTVEYMPVTDFRMTARGVIVSPDYARRVFIVDCTRSDGSELLGQKLDTDTMIDTTRFKKWLARRGMSVYDNRKDPRTGIGQRVIKLLESQEPLMLESRDYYGWCPETEAFLTSDGEVTAEGLRAYTKVYPEDKLMTDSPSVFRFDADLAQSRDWLKRILALQPEIESAKVGAWLMMLLLRGQWSGIQPGLLVDAFSGTGKTVFFQLLFKLSGLTNKGERLTLAAMRDKLMGNTSGAVWLDDVELDDKAQELMRGAVTSGSITHKESHGDGWVTVEKQLRASIVVSGEGVDWFRQKALRDRFIEVKFDRSIRTDDADKMNKTEDVSAGSGALLMAVLAQAHRLPELESMRLGITARDDQARTTLRIGARILDGVLDSGNKWTRIIDSWYLGQALEEDKGQASENVLNVFPIVWQRIGSPLCSGQGQIINCIWFDEVEKTFWIHASRIADYWAQTQKSLDRRNKQLTSQASINRELDACNAGKSVPKPTKRVNGDRTMVSYRQLPERYSRMVLDVIDHTHTDTEGD